MYVKEEKKGEMYKNGKHVVQRHLLDKKMRTRKGKGIWGWGAVGGEGRGWEKGGFWVFGSTRYERTKMGLTNYLPASINVSFLPPKKRCD